MSLLESRYGKNEVKVAAKTNKLTHNSQHLQNLCNIFLIYSLNLRQWTVSITTNYPNIDQQQKSESDSLESVRSSGYVPITFGKATNHTGIARSAAFHFGTRLCITTKPTISTESTHLWNTFRQFEKQGRIRSKAHKLNCSKLINVL